MASGQEPSLPRIFHGTFIFTPTPTQFSIVHNQIIGVDPSGRIDFIESHPGEPDFGSIKQSHGWPAATPVISTATISKRTNSTAFFFPGFIDTHTHASQYPNTGVFGSSTLLDWLETYTFPLESSMSSLDRAKTVYNRVVARSLSHGTTAAAYYATIHVPATNLLADICYSRGQRALIGRVCMDRMSPDTYRDESPEQGVKDTQTCIEYIQTLDPKGEIVRPVITPRFAPSCTPESLKLLGHLHKESGCWAQTHIAENKAEIEFVRTLFPESKNYASVYDEAGLLTEKMILAHAVHLTAEEIELVKQRNSKISHCPVSNTCLTSGATMVKKLMQAGIDVSLGTDMSGGFHPSILEMVRQALMVSRHVAMVEGDEAKLSIEEALWLATKGGAKCIGLEDKVGAFEVGMDWDAQLILLDHVDDPRERSAGDGSLEVEVRGGQKSRTPGPVDIFGWEKLEDCVAKWVYVGDDRNFDLYQHTPGPIGLDTVDNRILLLLSTVILAFSLCNRVPMDYFRVPGPVSSSTPPPQSSTRVSPQNLSTPQHHASSEHLPPPPSPKYKTDTPPFKPRQDDRFSLRQVFEPREVPTPTQEYPPTVPLERLRQSRRASSSLHRHFVNEPHHELASTQSDEMVRRGRGSTDATFTTRPASVAAKPDSRRDRRLHSTPADSSQHSSDDASKAHIPAYETSSPFREASIYAGGGYTSIEGPDGFEGFEGFEGMGGFARMRTNPHLGLPVPSEIRLRRATFNDIGVEARRDSATSYEAPTLAIQPRPACQTTYKAESGYHIKKGSSAGTALTHAYVHFFLPTDPEVERRSSVTEGRPRVSATLQVVRSRNSVYEVIWEDEDAFVDAEEMLPETQGSPSLTSENTAPSIAQGEPAGKAATKSRQLNTKMARWTWDGELEPYSRYGSRASSRRATLRSTPPESEPSTIDYGQPLEQPDASIFAHTLVPTAPPAPLPSIDLTMPDPQAPSPTNSVISESSSTLSTKSTVSTEIHSSPEEQPRIHQSQLTRPPPTPYSRSNLTAQRRRELLGNRKASGAGTDEADHFNTHRDSIVLAHKRIFKEDTAQAVRHVGDALVHGRTHGHEAPPADDFERRRAEIDAESEAHAARALQEDRTERLKRRTWLRAAARESRSSTATDSRRARWRKSGEDESSLQLAGVVYADREGDNKVVVKKGRKRVGKAAKRIQIVDEGEVADTERDHVKGKGKGKGKRAV